MSWLELTNAGPSPRYHPSLDLEEEQRAADEQLAALNARNGSSVFLSLAPVWRGVAAAAARRDRRHCPSRPPS